MAKYFSEPERWVIGKSVFAESLAEMARDGANGNEGVVMWLGRYDGPTAIISHLGILRGPHVQKKPDLLMIGSELINDLTDLALEKGVRLIAQIHSHSPLFGTDLSLTDRRHGIAVPGMLSLVAPDFALHKDTTLVECGVHIFQRGLGWRRFSIAEIQNRLSLSGDDDAVVLTAGA